jgi:hypothetical protein
MNIFLAGIIGANDLDRDAFDKVARAELFGLIDDAHAAFEDFADDVVPKIALNGEKSHAAMLGKVTGKFAQVKFSRQHAG